MESPMMEGNDDPPLATSQPLDEDGPRVPGDYVPIMNDEDEGPTSSVEAQADPSDLSSFDLDFEMEQGQAEVVPTLVSSQTLTASVPNDDALSAPNVGGFDNDPLAGLFDQMEGASLPEEPAEDDVKSDNAYAGVCGFRNFANTCYMNSGLQCLFATPAVVKFFTQQDHKDEDSPSDADSLCLSGKFGPLLNDVWSGQYSILKPNNFKSSLELVHPQFKGAHQHDCQEFLALLLGSLHEELKSLNNRQGQHEFNKGTSSYDCGTSMELHTPHSTERDVPVKMSWTPRNCSAETKSNLKEASKPPSNGDQPMRPFDCPSSSSGGGAAAPPSGELVNTDGTESRGSASPKSYDSNSSSLEDKVASAIRTLPIPNEVKAVPTHNCRDDGDDELEEEEEDEAIEEDSCSSSAHSSKAIITSNLVPADTLKKRPIHSTASAAAAASNAVNNKANGGGGGDDLDFLTKENKMLNVNVLSGNNGFYGEEIQNNKIDFDSEKFHNVSGSSPFEKKVRPHETIDNDLAGVDGGDGGAGGGGGDDDDEETCCKEKNVMNDFQAIKRMRLDSSEKEKNIQLEMERKRAVKKQPDDPVSDANNSDGGGELFEAEEDIDDDDDDVVAASGSLSGSGVGGGEACGGAVSSQTNNLKEAVEADRCWEKYLAANDTIVARTFHGQFKNTVVCSKCRYVSVSFEPFMYLPVPLPNAQIRQTTVTFVSAVAAARPMTFLLEMTHADNVANLKEKLLENLDSSCDGVQRKAESSKLQVAEVSDHHVLRTVDNWTCLKYLKDGEDNRTLYVIEVAAAAVAGESDEPELPVPYVSNTENLLDGFSPEFQKRVPRQDATVETNGPEPSGVLVNTEELLEGFNQELQRPFPSRPASSEDAAAANSSSEAVVPDLVGSSLPGDSGASLVEKVPEESNNNNSGDGVENCDTRYQSCVICMEDFASSLLRQHNACDCVMCCPCLDRTVEHNQQDNINCALGLIKCPGCRQDVNPETEFVALDQVGRSAPKLKMIMLSVVFRRIEGEVVKKQNIALFGHPGYVEVPNLITGKKLADLVDTINPLNHSDKDDVEVPGKFFVVNGQGKNCSRCIFNAQCFGCVSLDPQDDQTQVLLQPTDTIAVTYLADDLPVERMEEANRSEEHASVIDTPRIAEKLRLEHCLEAFSESELLDESNPWFCPVCRKNQCAVKTLTVWRFPDYLIVYLKRFVFLSNSTGALKLEKDVEFQVNNLDLTPYLSGPLQHGHRGQGEGRPVFNMYGCVCHFGSVYGGHYTAYSKHLGSGQWNYFDDNAVSQHRVPGQSAGDVSSAYVLFYQRAGSRQDSQLPFVSRKCRAFAMGEARTPPSSVSLPQHTQFDGLKPNNCNEELSSCRRNQNQLSNDEDDMAPTCPDLSQLIRSLDTPPPSS